MTHFLFHHPPTPNAYGNWNAGAYDVVVHSVRGVGERHI